MKIKYWLIYAFIIVTLVISLVFSLMIWSDTYSNIHSKRTEFFTEPNTRAIKVDYILENKKKYDSFIFGSSRVWNIDPTLIRDGDYYNMTYSEGIPHEHLLNINLFIQSNIKIKNLLIGLDEFSYQVSFDKHQSQALTRLHYLATDTNYFIYLRELYLRFPLGEDRRNIKKSFFGANTLKIDISNQTQKYTFTQKNFNRDKYTRQNHINNKIFQKPIIYQGDTLKSTLKDIKEIKNICKTNHINCTFFINPIHKKTYEYINMELLNEFRYNLSKITDYYDFSFPNKISNNNSYWLETSHFTIEVGNMILDRIYNNNTDIKNFGIYINE